MIKKISLLIMILITMIMIFSGCTATDTADVAEEASTSQDAVSIETDSSEDQADISAENIDNNFPEYKVVRVVDGDTLVIDYEGTDEKLRLIGVDTPESVHPDKTKNSAFGDEVSAYSKSQLENKSVGIEFDVQERDQYGRLLAYVYIGDKMYNKTLLEHGYASVATFPPNVKYVDDFTALQKKAREAEKGMWSPEFQTDQAGSNSSESSNTEKESGKYNGHKKNKKFHIPGCRYGDMISDDNLIVFSTRNAALDAGYAACKVCHP